MYVPYPTRCELAGDGACHLPHDIYGRCHAVLAEQVGYVAVIKVYMDESGTHEGSQVLCAGAYIGKSKDWRAFTKAWNLAKKPIKVFHAVDCANLAEGFEGWTDDDRDKYVARLLLVLTSQVLLGLGVGFHMKALKEALSDRPDLDNVLGSPYAACFLITLPLIIQHMESLGGNARVAFFHEQNDYHGLALQSFRWVPANRDSHTAPMSLRFGSKADFVPLQVADVLAYETNKRFRDRSRKPRRSWVAMGGGSGGIQPARVITRSYEASNMHTLISVLSEWRDVMEQSSEEDFQTLFSSRQRRSSGRSQ
jgi:Protein of unknown function (DUF3800)